MKFSERFNITLDLSEAERRFVNRISNLVFDALYWGRLLSEDYQSIIHRRIATDLGEKYDDTIPLNDLLDNDFSKYLQAVETFSMVAKPFYRGEEIRNSIDRYVRYALDESEVDLGIDWRDGIFTRKGAKLLDEFLVNEPIRWLADAAYHNVREPFEKSLRHFLESAKRPELLADAVTDAYEALEALAKIATGRDKDLSANYQLLLGKLNVSGQFKPLLKEYIEFANNFRHATNTTKPKPKLSIPEVELFIYLTGAMIRLTKESIK